MSEIEPVEDWTADEEEQAALKEPVPAPHFGPDEHRETTRAQLAKWLMALLTLTVLTILALAFLEMAGALGDEKGELRDVAQFVLTPVVTLVGTALGFYFGAQSVGGGKEEGQMPTPRPPGKIRQFGRWLW
jgi:hypothetical protein